MILDLLENGDPARIAISLAGNGLPVTYDQLRQQVDALVEELSRLGLEKRDRIAMALPNGLEVIASFLAASTVGTAAPLNPAYTRDEFKFYLEDTGARALIVPSRGADEAKAAAGDDILLIEADIDRDGRVRCSSKGKLSARSSDHAEEDIALILHTSGTTSRPKRVPLSHTNLTTSARNVAETYQLTPEDVSLCVMPLFHVHGLVASTLATLFTGGTVVVPSKFNPLSFWSTVRESGATWYSAVPTIHQVLLSRTKGTRPAGAEQLRFVRSCSAALAPPTMADLEARFGVPVLEAYGMTEAAHQMASNPLPPGARKPGSVGRGTAVEIAILNEAGDILAPSATGEVSIRGANVFGGYEGNPAANAESFSNGWFRTGDQGYLDEEGYLTLVGRIKELINRGGEKISPREIDETLLTHAAVAEAVSFGIPDRVYGEDVAAAVVLKESATEKDLIDHCRSKLAEFKCPRTIYIVETIPRTATGKIQRRNVAAAITNNL
ncbi:MAG TPA: acyl--CoA ligase [Pyrinomonadaceae bacterium]|jgi:acyl-CoA synthetase (AMP-forming)/AMP-acid ligase II|nr:acyl--CoA ligase [Pyrinomonadaceae bacterium]